MRADVTGLELCLGGVEGTGIHLASSHHLPADLGVGNALNITW